MTFIRYALDFQSAYMRRLIRQIFTFQSVYFMQIAHADYLAWSLLSDMENLTECYPAIMSEHFVGLRPLSRPKWCEPIRLVLIASGSQEWFL